MKNKARQLTLQQYGELYHRMDNVPFDSCWYCGAPRTCLDHCPPLGYLQHMDPQTFRKKGGYFLLVPSCESCNSLLGARKLLTPPERISWLLGAYNKLFDKAYFGWTDEEVAEMGYGLKVMIHNSRIKANLYLDKVRAIEQRILEIKDWD